MTSGGLRLLQEIQAEPGSMLAEYIMVINNCYPEEIIRWLILNIIEIIPSQATIIRLIKSKAHQHCINNHV